MGLFFLLTTAREVNLRALMEILFAISQTVKRRTISTSAMRDHPICECQLCHKEIPKSVARTTEGTDYVWYFLWSVIF
jgi:hypothetical protein